MDTGETKIYMAILAALAVFIILVVTFVASIIKSRHSLDASYKKQAARDIDAMDEDRKRIGFDLHDDIGASLSSVKLQLECIDVAREGSSQKIQKLVTHLDQIIINLKRISWNMVPSVLQRNGLDAALKELLSKMIVPQGMKIEYEYRLHGPVPGKVVHIYRLTQEILNNALKHSKAGTLKIRLSKSQDTIILRVEDDGIGFNKEVVHARSEGLGLRSISARALLLNAEVELETRPGHGTAYKITIPV